jgi:hypothetical protein
LGKRGQDSVWRAFYSKKGDPEVAIITPEQYIESLKDGRLVYCEGERVEDVTEHPILKICRDWVAMD